MSKLRRRNRITCFLGEKRQELRFTKSVSSASLV